MSLGRLWRTVRHLTFEQWVYRVICRGRRLLMRHTPFASRRRIERLAAQLPLPDPGSEVAGGIADIVLQLQTAVHGGSFEGAPAGKFSLLNREYDFGGLDGVSWRGEFHEGNNPLRRMNLAYMGYAVPLLARGRHADLGALLRLVRSLEEQNPWAEPGVFRDVWNAYTASHRLINLLSGLALYRRARGQPDDAAEKEILEHVRFCAAFVRANLERDLQYNHLMKNYVALAAFAGTCGTVPGTLSFLQNAIPRSIRQNILPDGGHSERCPMYHVLSLLDVRVFQACGLFTGENQAMINGTTERMSAALPAMMLADGEVALMNDSWMGEAPRADAVISRPSTGKQELPFTGYVALSGDRDSVVFDCGPCGPDDNPGHAHADFLSIEAAVAGNRFLVDTGVSTYTAGEARNRSRSAAAHNGPRLDGLEPIEFWKSFRVGRRGYAGLLDMSGFGSIAPLATAGWQTGYSHVGVDVRRLVALWPGRALLVADLWSGQIQSPKTHFLIPAAWAAGSDGAFSNGGVRVETTTLVGVLSEISAASHWLRFGVELPAHRLSVTPEMKDTGARAATLFVWDEGSSPEMNIDRILEALSWAIPRKLELG